MSLRNFTPSSTALASPSSMIVGVVVAGFHRLHGHDLVTVTPADGDSTLPLSSIARLVIDMAPTPLIGHESDQVVRPVARCHVVPPSSETSTAATRPSASEAAPVTVRFVFDETELPVAGEPIVDVGGATSADGVPGVNPPCSSAGCAPMSPSRLTVACCRGGVVESPTASRRP